MSNLILQSKSEVAPMGFMATLRHNFENYREEREVKRELDGGLATFQNLKNCKVKPGDERYLRVAKRSADAMHRLAVLKNVDITEVRMARPEFDEFSDYLSPQEPNKLPIARILFLVGMATTVITVILAFAHDLYHFLTFYVS